MVVRPNQSFADVILQGCGSMEAGMQVAADNALPISISPLVGSNVMITAAASALGDSGTLRYLAQNSIVIGTLNAPLTPLITEDGSEDIVSEDGGSILIGED